ncbi:MAG: hypothetical protein RMK79_01375 [Anaerolineae bacterium]|nr:hypothetical protein [Anaerolineae bacterium]
MNEKNSSTTLSRFLSQRSSLTTCMIVTLVTISFSIGGLLGGIVGGGLVLWASGLPLNTMPTQLDRVDPPLCECETAVSEAALASPTPTATETPTPTLTLIPPTPSPTATATPSLADSVARVLPAVVTIVNQRPATSRAGTTSTPASGDPAPSSMRGATSPPTTT